MLYIRKKLKQYVLSPWPDCDEHTIHERVIMEDAIQTAIRQRLITRQDMLYALRYACGYEEREHESVIRRVLSVLSVLTGYTDMQYTKTVMPDASALQQQIYIAHMRVAPLWNAPDVSTDEPNTTES